MAAFSIFTQDDEPAVVESAHDAPVDETLRTGALSGAEPSDDRMPEVVLRLPVVTAEEHASIGLPSAFRDRIFWVLIGLGALLALGLVWTGKKAAPKKLDDAPGWHDQVDHHVPRLENFGQASTPQANSPPADIAPAWQPPAEGPVLGEATEINSYSNPQNSPSAAADADAFAPRAEQAERVRDTRWDGAAPTVAPGEAAPLGTLITTGSQP